VVLTAGIKFTVITLILLFVIWYFQKKLVTRQHGKGAVDLKGYIRLDKNIVAVVEAGGRHFLIGSCDKGVNLIAELKKEESNASQDGLHEHQKGKGGICSEVFTPGRAECSPSSTGSTLLQGTPQT